MINAYQATDGAAAHLTTAQDELLTATEWLAEIPIGDHEGAMDEVARADAKAELEVARRALRNVARIIKEHATGLEDRAFPVRRMATGFRGDVNAQTGLPEVLAWETPQGDVEIRLDTEMGDAVMSLLAGDGDGTDCEPPTESSAPQVPQQLRDAQWAHTCEGLRIWELGEVGGHVIALGHVDRQWMASAILTLYIEHGEPLGEVKLTDIRHTNARLEDTPDGLADFVMRFGEGDLRVTEWRLGSGTADEEADRG